MTASGASESELLATARAWAKADCDDDDRAVTQALVDAVERRNDERAQAQLARGFSSMLDFGTAGMRGEVMPGPGGMNRAIVRLTTRAVADHLRQAGLSSRPVIVGFDARLSSRRLAEETVGTLVASGLSVRFFAVPTPTPLVAYAVLHQGACAGIVITASHNPSQDNGYKLYGADGIQIVSPVDEAIAELRRAVGEARCIPCAPGALGQTSARCAPISSDVIEDYFRDIADLAEWAPAPEADVEAVRLVYTPVHGVGGAYVERALRDAGFRQLHIVREQAAPDGHFPTAKNPNPERPEVLDAAFCLACEVGAEVVLANDPDADRLAVGVPKKHGGFSKLTGNQIGVLLADSLLASTGCPRPLVVTSIVSTPMLEKIAEQYGARRELTLTGFKWLWTAGLELSRKEYDLVLAFEEALGFSIGAVVRDKDGISAALVFAKLVAAWRSTGQSVSTRLEGLYRQHGLWVSTQLAVRRESPEGRQEIQAAVRTLAGSPPESLFALQVTGVVDYRRDGTSRPRWLGEAPLIELALGQRGRVLVRPSGTEPLLKIYVDLCEPVSSANEVWEQEAALLARADQIAREVARVAGIVD